MKGRRQSGVREPDLDSNFYGSVEGNGDVPSEPLIAVTAEPITCAIIELGDIE